MSDPDDPVSDMKQCVRTFLHSDRSLDPPPKNGEAQLRIFPVLKTKHEGDPVMGNDLIRLHFINDLVLNMSCAGMEESGEEAEPFRMLTGMATNERMSTESCAQRT